MKKYWRQCWNFLSHFYVTLLQIFPTDEEKRDDLIDQCHQLLQYTILIESILPEHPLEEFIESLRQVLLEMTQDKERRQVSPSRGRPRVQVDEQQLQFLLDNNFRIKDIAVIFGCSTRTIERRKRELQLTSGNYSMISDIGLDTMVEEITHLYPHCGEKILSGRLHSNSIHIQRQRIRDSLH